MVNMSIICNMQPLSSNTGQFSPRVSANQFIDEAWRNNMQFGHFDDEQREYVITRPDTPLPWINYLGQ